MTEHTDQLEWRISASSWPISNPDEWDTLADAFLDALIQDPDALGPVGSGQVGKTIGTIFIVEAANLGDAAELGNQVISRALGRMMGPAHPEFELLNVAPADWEPTTWIGASQVGELLGVSRQRVYQLLKTLPDFPRPARDGDRGQVWDREAVESWSKLTRHPGRPSSSRAKAAKVTTVKGRPVVKTKVHR